MMQATHTAYSKGDTNNVNTLFKLDETDCVSLLEWCTLRGRHAEVLIFRLSM